jgi:hypothetical protein
MNEQVGIPHTTFRFLTIPFGDAKLLCVPFRKYREINLNDIGKDISDSVTPILNETEPVGNLVNLYDTNLKLVCMTMNLSWTIDMLLESMILQGFEKFTSVTIVLVI